MANYNEKNIYFGPDSLKQYFNPDSQPPLPLVELPEYLNPYYHDGVRIYAKMMTMHPANNVKAMPGMKETGKYSLIRAANDCLSSIEHARNERRAEQDQHHYRV